MRTALITLLLVGSAVAISQNPPPRTRPVPGEAKPRDARPDESRPDGSRPDGARPGAEPDDAQATPPRSPLTDDEKIPPSPLVKFMRTKLGASNLILEGLCMDDMAKIEKGVGRLLEMSDEERWRVSNDVLYLNHSREFRRAVLTLKEKAADGNTDGVALAWIDVTMNCVRCHSWVRDTIVVDGLPAAGPTAAEGLSR